MRSRLILALLIGLVFALAGCAKPVPAGREVRVAAAADLKYAFDDLAAAFRAKHPDIAVSPTYGASGNFYAQLENQAPYDLFLSADFEYPRKLVAGGRAVAGSEFQYAVGHLVVWVPNPSKLDLDGLGIKVVADPTVKKVAIANPKVAPYGRAAEAALKSLGVYDAVRDRLVFGDNIAQTAQFVESGAADVGVIALSLVLSPGMKDKGRYWPVPLDAHPRLEQGGVIITGAADPAAAATLREFITGAEGREVLKRYGFTLPGE
ncbi:molybdate ABC transporter substrate-binding protein [Fimbriiglobus ruber]|uniref:Molybdenum ABC transporter, periplasmic molybdenum-binding protein ModA n=1 Tax=Fimbriiglobus ruber TaxID=1908690 RepID=A0A225DLN6_9BACT|nr:molybdate ABC transporter substrate-binding protein [Fimbriiglobus ruber]OWK41893.1 Molybdenum ABC transporter, periplasmic molybdenum-binding protein ModA [Fimbriiglobus ruber]